MHDKSILTFTQRAAIESLRKSLTRRFQRAVTVDYGYTDDGQIHDALLGIEVLREGPFNGAPAPLVSLLAGPGIGGHGYAAMSAQGLPLADGVSFVGALQAVKFAAVHEHRKITKGRR